MSERKAERKAAAQYGVISKHQALECGMSEHSIERRVQTGRWIRMHSGVYRLAGAPERWLARLMAAQLWGGEGTVISHRSAASLYELDGVSPGYVEVTLSSSKKVDGVIVHRDRYKQSGTRMIKGFVVTSVERTLLDLCAVLSPTRCGRAVDDALRRRITTLERLLAICERHRGKAGCRVLRQLIALRDRRDEQVASRLETRLLRILKRVDPKIVPQHPVAIGDQKYFIDFACPDRMTGFEAHSIEWHLGEEQLKSDVRRDRRLRIAGWKILYFCRDDIWFDAAGVEADARAILGLI
jgi:very-short-patch-repair endonuclease